MAAPDADGSGFNTVWERTLLVELRDEADNAVGSTPRARERLLMTLQARAPEPRRRSPGGGPAAAAGPLAPPRAQPRASASAYRAVLSSRSDLFFVFESDAIDRRTYSGALQEAHDLTTPFEGLPALLLSLAGRCDGARPGGGGRGGATVFAVLLLSACASRARLTFVEDLDIKFVELLSLSFAPRPRRSVEAAANDRYSRLAARAEAAEARLGALTDLVRRRYPGLLVQFEQQAAEREAAAEAPAALAPRGATAHVAARRAGAGAARPEALAPASPHTPAAAARCGCGRGGAAARGCWAAGDAGGGSPYCCGGQDPALPWDVCGADEEDENAALAAYYGFD
ncbi:hypothetical protein Rsub_08742 [Raphidocelis subcapitata]|uniref:Spindle assembly abnormal protein 6 N-terminal domain-containing protein n=1 Tax=Raphidocelis subcapitata TaxID=307507 RepID=A0A2V0PG67_9CHLO|nr:hypothetical protein Rsub_08742 [Raphidocelis subcapitata]|eukprot:GBF96197.1 hypothetical protein Rsub_08742 [Raphidocelis subcapitata]